MAALASTLLLFLLGELAARAMGVRDFPVYDVSATVGYIPAPNQSGAFLNRNRWYFNERSMGVDRPFRPTADGILLVGDSIVLGGVWVDQSAKLGPVIEHFTGCPTWPVAAGSWALSNELQHVLSNPDLMRVGTLVIVSNSGDFGAPSVWRSDYTHPRSRPRSALLYAIEKKFWPINENTRSAESPAATALWQARLAEVRRRFPGRIAWVIYPDKTELARTPAAFAPLIQAIGDCAELVFVGNDRRWGPRFYRDRIHPDPDGYRRLGAIIADRLPRCGHA